MKEELNIWTKNYIDVNSLVTEKFMMQKALDKAKTDFESLMKKYQDLEQKHKKILTDYSATKAKCKSYEEFGSSRWVEGAVSETNSDQDSGKHSDTSLVNSSEECWAEIDKINKSYNKRQNKGSSLIDGSDQPRQTRSKLVQPVPVQTQQTNLRNVMKNSEQRPGGPAGCSLTPTPASSSTKIQESEALAGDNQDDAGVEDVGNGFEVLLRW